MWTVTRQRQWPDGGTVVEISSGGIDYCNPGALTRKYRGEMEEYEDSREAVKAAWEIAQAWQKDCPNEKILIDHGATGGMTMPFDGMKLTKNSRRLLDDWAKEAYDKLPKCDRCGDILPKDPYVLHELDEKFCREYCAQERYDEVFENVEEEVELD